jgi:hypothetical protein
VAQLPDGDTTHQVLVSDVPILGNPTGATLAHTFSGYTVSGQVLEHVFPSPITARYAQIRTIASPSWSAWNEVQVFARAAIGPYDQVICLKTNTFSAAGSTNRFIPLLVPTNVVAFLGFTNSSDWFVSVVNRERRQVSLQLCAKTFEEPACTNCAGAPFDTLGILPGIPDNTHATNSISGGLTCIAILPPGPVPPGTNGPGVGFTMQWAAQPGESYRIEKSTNLVEWWIIGTYEASGSVMSYTETNSAPMGFYRVR